MPGMNSAGKVVNGYARADVFEYIETYYNRKRRHSTLNYQSPWDFENRMAA
jgi:transposase InsO family protein